MAFQGILKFLGINGVPEQSNHENSVQQNLLKKVPFGNNIHTRNKDAGIRRKIAKCFGDCLPGAKFLIDVRSGEQEKVHLWLSTMARTESILVFEYVHSTERGLSFKEAEERLKVAGPNIPVGNLISSWWDIFSTALWHPFNIILFVLAALCFIANDKANGSIMVTMVIISVSVRFYQEFSSSRAALKLSELVKASIKVQRCAGREIQTELQVQIDQKDVVPGDIIIFSAGDLFPGDVRLLSSKSLVVSQSSLTGESGIVEKLADVIENPATPLLELRNICFMGTTVVSGSGTGVVVSTGDRTYISTILSALGKRSPPHAFEKGVRGVSYVLISFMLAIVPVIVIVDYFTTKNLGRSILFGVSVAVGLTPQMLPLIVNTNLARGALAMARDKCIVKRLVAIQNMGAMDILCTDKTGTLTMNRLVLVHHLDCQGMSSDKILYFAFLNSHFQTGSTNPLDDAILAYAYTGGYRFQPTKWKKINEVPFDFTRRRMSVILEERNDNQASRKKLDSHAQRIMVLKGAYEEVLKVCSFFQNDITKDTVEPLLSQDYLRLLNIAEELSNDGLRVIAVATRKLKSVVIDSARVCKLAGLMIEGAYKHIFWTPCCVHALNNTLKDIGKIDWIKTVVAEARNVQMFVCNHHTSLALFRTFSKKEFLKPVETRYASYFILMERMLEVQESLQSMVVNAEWTRWHESSTQEGKTVKQKILDDNWWGTISYICSFIKPIVEVIRYADSDSPSLGEIYETFDSMLGKIRQVIQSNDPTMTFYEEHLRPIVTRRWNIMNTPLHMAAYAVNPKWYAPRPGRLDPSKDDEVKDGFFKALLKMYSGDDARKIRAQWIDFTNLRGPTFGRLEAKIDRDTIAQTDPIGWWTWYGKDAPDLRTLAVRLLSQVASSSAAERNWSTYSFIHSIKRNNLTSRRAEKLVAVHSALRLQDRQSVPYRQTPALRWDVDPEDAQQIDENDTVPGLVGVALDEEPIPTTIESEDDSDSDFHLDS